jgi:hypothetical protein
LTLRHPIRVVSRSSRDIDRDRSWSSPTNSTVSASAPPREISRSGDRVDEIVVARQVNPGRTNPGLDEVVDVRPE